MTAAAAAAATVTAAPAVWTTMSRSLRLQSRRTTTRAVVGWDRTIITGCHHYRNVSPSMMFRTLSTSTGSSNSRSRKRRKSSSSGGNVAAAALENTTPITAAAGTTTPITRQSRQTDTASATPTPTKKTETASMNLFSAINDALRIALETDPTAIIFGQDVAFGGVFRCTSDLRETFGPHRVFNTPLSENGIAGLAIGYASLDAEATAIAECQFADYIYPMLDQLINEAAKFRYRSGNQWQCGGVTIRAPCGAVGHGGHYHSQSPEAMLTHTPGLTVVMCPAHSPTRAKGLLLSSIRCRDPVIFLEPKAYYRTSVDAHVPTGDYMLPLSQAHVVQEGSDITLVGWGGQIPVLLRAAERVLFQSSSSSSSSSNSNHHHHHHQNSISCEVIDLETLLPWDTETVEASVRKTGKLLVSHEAPITCGFGAEVVARIQQSCFWHLQAPVLRVCGYDTPFPLVLEKIYVPDEFRVVDAIRQTMEAAR